MNIKTPFVTGYENMTHKTVNTVSNQTVWFSSFFEPVSHNDAGASIRSSSLRETFLMWWTAQVGLDDWDDDFDSSFDRFAISIPAKQMYEYMLQFIEQFEDNVMNGDRIPADVADLEFYKNLVPVFKELGWGLNDVSIIMNA